MTVQLRIYNMKPGKLPDWERLFHSGIAELRTRQGFEILGAWSIPDAARFVWVLSYEGTREDFDAADRAYYELPEHEKLHEAALEYLDSGEAHFVEPMDGL